MAAKQSFAQALVAQTILSEMSPCEIEVLQPHIGLIKKIQESITKDIAKCRIDEVCGKCSGVCCYHFIEDGFDPATFMYILSVISEEERKKIFYLLNSPNYTLYCSLLTKNGCVLPDYARPLICKSFFCGKISGGFKLMKKHNKPLDKAFTRFYRKLCSIGINL